MKLNLGCGTDLEDGFVNSDIVDLPGVDVVADLDQPWPWPDGTAEYIVASHVFEHVDKPVLFMTEAHRVLQPGGILEIRVPHWKHPNAYTDPTHRRFCTEQTFHYWIQGTVLHDQFGPMYGSPPAVFTMTAMFLMGEQGQELKVMLEKPAFEQPSTSG